MLQNLQDHIVAPNRPVPFQSAAGGRYVDPAHTEALFAWKGIVPAPRAVCETPLEGETVPEGVVDIAGVVKKRVALEALFGIAAEASSHVEM